MEKGRRIRDVRLQAYEAHAQRLGGIYRTERSLVENIEAKPSNTYIGQLPRFDDKTFIDILTEKLTTDTQATIADLGCGNGQFLLDLAGKEGDRLKLIGVTSYPYHKDSPSHEKNLKDTGIHILEGDMQTVSRIIAPNSVDIVTSVYAFEYLADPWMALKQTYDILKPEGIGLITAFPIDRTIEYSQSLMGRIVSYLSSKYGMKFTYNQQEGVINVSFQKKRSRLTLPLSYGKVETLTLFKGKERIRYPILTYSYDSRVVSAAK